MAGIGGKRCTQPLLVFILFFVGGCASQTTISKPRPQGTYHIVTPGETLFRIGKAYGVTYQELARVNGIKDAGQIRVGQRLFIPGATRPLPVETITPAEPPAAAPVSPEPGFETFLWPVNGTINSGFGPRGSSFHDGIDIAAPEGTPILAIEAGEVIYSDQLRGYGNMVILRHADGVVSVYAHNEANLVREGQSVVRGEVVARVGSTGRVSGPHLHFEIRRNNAAQDPLRYLPQLCCVAAADNVSPKN
ncbi:MAG TPA: LysM peptidoglycan-binding domain-containing M23 family metallopeptidase [Candidatus Binatia bacterium]|nr:LysM peptidoglycan-binding domain-containing M23 family metallopeptidase [Candidatus Binatia bacterium]